MKSRIKQPITPIPTLHTRDDAEAAMTDLANAANNQRALIAQRDAAILAINQRFEKNLAAYDIDIKARTDSLRCWAEANPEEFPKGRKSLALTSGTLGFRTGTPKLALLSRSWTWEKVLEAIKLRAFQFIRTKEEVDKDAILNFVAAGPESRDELQKKVCTPIGVKITQDESFFIEPDLTQYETRQTEAA